MQGRTLAALMVMAAALGIGLGAVLPSSMLAPLSRPNWKEIAWPFSQDAWPTGRAFRCTSAACGGGLEVYLRAKVGLCNCSQGITGDAEVDAVSDVDMMAVNFVPLARAVPVEMANMAGLSRPYRLALPDGRMVRAAGMALSHRCDLVAGASVGEQAGTDLASNAIAALVERDGVKQWLLDQMGKS